MILPKNVVLELTYHCNHKCLFCSCPWESAYSKYEKGVELNTDEWKRAINRLLNHNIEYFSISGGEAILKKDAKEIIQYIRQALTTRQINTEITLISNGLGLSRNWLEFFKENNVHLSISFPGVETFKKHTGIENVNGIIRRFKEAKDIGLKTTANITVTKLNFYELEKNIALALISGANDILLNRFLPGGRGLSYMKDLTISTKQINEMLEITENVLSIANRYGSIGTEIPLCCIDNPSKYKYLHIGYKCAAATGFFVVGPAGEIRTCNHSPKIVGHIFNENIISDTEYWNQFSLDSINIKECENCIGRPICSCGCREVASILTSDINSIDPSVELVYSNLYQE